MVGVTFSSHGSVAVRSAPASLVPPSRGRLTWLGDNVSAKVVSAKVFRVTKLAFSSMASDRAFPVNIESRAGKVGGGAGASGIAESSS